MNLKQFIFSELDNGNYITDSALANFCKGDPNFSTAEEYKRRWQRLQADKRFFEDREIKEKHKTKRRHIIELTNGDCYTCGADFYKTI